MQELERQVAVPVGSVAFSGAMTMDRLTPAQAERLEKQPCPVGMAWGHCWEYGWFTAELRVPEDCAGKRLVLYSGVGGEQLVYVNGHAVGSVDKEHHEILLTRSAQPGETFHILLESYAGHGARLENSGPIPPERKAIPPTPETQCRVGESFFAEWNEDAYQLLLDVRVLQQLLEVLPDKSLRAQKVAEGLERFTEIVEFEQTRDGRDESYRRARKALAPLLACHNGSTAPTMWLIGQSHIDLGWLWPMEETYHKSARTYSNQLTLLKEYPSYRYYACEPALLQMLREYEPDLWQELKEAHARGQILPDGAFYVECDTNLPAGESLIRQLMWGKRWFREQFGTESRVAWQPDTFGFTAALPQLLKGFDIPYFATQKLLRADPEYPRFPYQNFTWEGLDGTEVCALSFFKDNAICEPKSFCQRWEEDRTQQEGIDTLLFPFGYGDGGGGPTRDMVETAERLQDLEGVARSHYGSIADYFAYTEPASRRNRWVGELYLQWHRGTYTAQRRTKALMRRTEEALHDTELLTAMLPAAQQAAQKPLLDHCWEKLMLNQFHDLAAGVGIRRVHEEQLRDFREALDALRKAQKTLLDTLYPVTGEGWSVFEPLPWSRNAVVELPGHQLMAVRTVPSGVAPAEAMPAPEAVEAEEKDGCFLLRNAYVSATVDAEGCLIHLIDRSTGRDVIDPGQRMNEWRLYKNIEPIYDAWEMDSRTMTRQADIPMTTRVSLWRKETLRAELLVERTFSGSTARQIIRLDATSGRIDFITDIDWDERHKLLKVGFEHNVLCEEARHEIQFGYVTRPTHRSDRKAAAQYEVSQHRYTAVCEEQRCFAVLNDSSYGVSTDRHEIALSLVRAPLVPDETCDRGHHSLTYAVMVYSGTFRESGVIEAGYALNQPVQVLEGKRETSAGIYAEHAIVETVKPAEDGDGIIVRAYVPVRAEADAVLCLPRAAEVIECGLAENQAIPMGTGDRIPFALKPFQIRTFRVRGM